jgi:hypothetical protein
MGLAMSLVTRFSLAISVIFVFAVGMSGLLGIRNFEHIFVSLRESRLAISLQDMRETLEMGLRIKESLGALRSYRPMLDTIKANDSNILAIEVFDDSGRIRFGTDPSFERDFIGQSWHVAARNAGTGQWMIDDKDTGLYVVGVPLVNARHAVVGGVALLYDQAGMRRTVQAIGQNLAWASAMGIAVAIAWTIGAVGILMRPTRRLFADMADRAAAVLASTSPHAAAPARTRPRTAGPGPGPGPAPELEHDFTGFLAVADSARSEIDATVRLIHEIDDRVDEEVRP